MRDDDDDGGGGGGGGNGYGGSSIDHHSRSRSRDSLSRSPISYGHHNRRSCSPRTSRSRTRGREGVGVGHHRRRPSRENLLANSQPLSEEDQEMSPSENGGGGSVVSGFSLMQEASQSAGREPSHESSGRSGRDEPSGSSRNRDGSVGRSEGREGRGGGGGGGGRRSADPDIGFLKDTNQHGRSSGRVGGGSGGIGGGGAIGARGMEPAVKSGGLMSTMTFLKLLTGGTMATYIIKLWTQQYDPSSATLCPVTDEHHCCTSISAKVLLTVSRATAGALIPSIACCMLSKCYALRYFLHHSWLALVVSFEPAHEFHTFFGWLTLLFGLIHGLAHVARAISEGHPNVLFDDPMFRSGLVAASLMLLIVLPMMLACLKKLMTFEVRKALHMIFIPFVLALCFHGEATRILCIVLLVVYIVDRLYFTTRMSFHIERPVFRPVGRGTFVRFDLPPGYQFRVGAYIQVNCPAINATEWHPFSIFPVPGPRPRAGFHVEAVGDWTQELFRLSLEDPCMPLWITAAQPSVLEKSIFYDNVLLVCTGAGITPAVSLAGMFSTKKNVHLMWLSREAGMVAMFEKQLRLVKSTVHLTGSPSEKTKQRMIDLLAPSKKEVFTTTAVSACPRPSPYVDLASLEAGGGGGVGGGSAAADGNGRPYSYRGELREDDEGSSSYRQGRSTENGDAAGGVTNANSCRSKRVPYGQPISLNFGRPDIGKFIAGTVQGTVREGKWVSDVDADAHDGGFSQPLQQQPERRQQHGGAGVRATPQQVDEEAGEGRPMPMPIRREVRSRKGLARLNTNQRISKRDLMTADLSVVAADPKGSPAPGPNTLDGTPVNTPVGGGLRGGSLRGSSLRGGGSGDCPSCDPRTWLVLYCGANAKVEKAVATACDGMGVTWRKEYFSAW
ncbi:unnamed protein product [Pylaiella littoralis]